MILYKNTKVLETVIESGQTLVIDTNQLSLVGVQVTATVPGSAVIVPAASVTVATDTLTYTAHGLFTGEKVRLTTSGSLPAGLALATDYYVVVVDANNFKLASSLANALLGAGNSENATVIDITSQGSGNHTVTPTAISGGSYKLQHSADFSPELSFAVNSGNRWSGANSSGTFVDAVSGESNTQVTNNITTTGTTVATLINNVWAFTGIAFAISAGTVKLKVTVNGKQR